MTRWIQRARSNWLRLLVLLITVATLVWTILGYMDLAELLRLVN